jgi:transposase-like protein
MPSSENLASASPRARFYDGSYALVPEFEKCWQAYERPVGGSWRVDETYLKVSGQWMYLYRAVDKRGKTVESYLESNA